MTVRVGRTPFFFKSEFCGQQEGKKKLKLIVKPTTPNELPLWPKSLVSALQHLKALRWLDIETAG